jgi:hypothetical protein
MGRGLKMSEEQVAVIIGMIVSVLLEVVPGLKKVWSTWRWKPLSLFVGFLAVSVVAWALSCFAGMPLYDPKCGLGGVLVALATGFVAFLANQGSWYLATRRLPNARSRAESKA